MPGYVIHLAVAREYLRNFRVKDEEAFLKGTIDPDYLAVNGDKRKTHCSPKGGAEVDLKQFLKENKIDSSYMEGFFLHLVVDYLFYNYYFTNYDKNLCDDYDIINRELINKYKVVIPEKIKEFVCYKDGELKVLDREKLDKMISEISKKNIKEYIREAKKTGIVIVSRKENNIALLEESKSQKIKLAVAIFAICMIMLLFMGQKEGYHCDEVFSYGSSNSAYENIFWSYREKTPMHIFMNEKIFQDGNLIDWIKRIKYYFVDHVEEKDIFIGEKMSEEKMIWKTPEEAENYVMAKDNRFNYASVYYNQIQDVHPPLFYMIVHTISSIFNNTFSKYMIFFINIPFFIGVCIIIWKILNLLRQKKSFNIGRFAIWIKYRWNFNYDDFKNVYDANIFYCGIFVY